MLNRSIRKGDKLALVFVQYIGIGGISYVDAIVSHDGIIHKVLGDDTLVNMSALPFWGGLYVGNNIQWYDDQRILHSLRILRVINMDFGVAV
jgi:hypothetical protein